MFTPTPKIQAMVFGGPSFFSVKQGIVNDFEITETYPYDTATFSRGVTTARLTSRRSGSTSAPTSATSSRGRSASAAASSGRARRIDVPASGGTGTFEIKAGGFQAGGGLRLRF